MKQIKQISSLAAAVVMLTPAVSSSAGNDSQVETNRTFRQESFQIGLSGDPRFDKEVDARYKKIAEAHYSFVVVGWGARTIERKRDVLQLCEKYGLKAIVDTGNVNTWNSDVDGMTDNLSHSPALMGYKFSDEPIPLQFKELRSKKDLILAANPSVLALVNLFPNYVNLTKLETKSYDDYIKQFMDIYEPQILCMDHYPSFPPGKNIDGRNNYCKNLETMRKYTLKAGIPFWNYFLSIALAGLSDPTEDQMRWQTSASVAYGAKGVIYFAYYPVVDPHGDLRKGYCIYDLNDRLTRHYEEAKRINFQLKNLGPTLMKLTSTGVYRVRDNIIPQELLDRTRLTAIDRVVPEYNDPIPNLLIGTFKHDDARQALFIMNYEFAYSSWATLRFNVPVSEIMEIDKTTGKEIAAIDACPLIDDFQITLKAGEGRLFIFSAF